MSTVTSDQDEIRSILELWAQRTRSGELDQILSNHASDVLIYDVLPPLKYEGAEAYRRSWGDWHPENVSEGHFDLRDLAITAGENVAFASGFIDCGGTAPNGKVYSDTVRATFCLQKTGDGWKISHQHISKPLSMK